MAKTKKEAPQEPKELSWVVLLKGNSYHYCLVAEFEAAKDQPGFNWEPKFYAATENECVNYILAS